MSKKGITPIIAVIVLLLITVSMAGLAYTFLFGVLIGQIEKSFFIPPGGVFCEETASGTQITIVIRNTGTAAGLAAEDFIIKTVTNATDERSIPDADFGTSAIQPQDSEAIQTKCGDPTVGCGSGVNTLKLSTGVTTERRIVRCP